jgi:hypothetical protein
LSLNIFKKKREKNTLILSTRKPYLIGSGVDGQLYDALLGPGHHEAAGSIMGGGQLVCPLCAALSRAVGAGRPARRQACQHSLPPAQQKAVPIGLKRKSVCKILKKYDKAFIFTKIFAKL